MDDAGQRDRTEEKRAGAGAVDSVMLRAIAIAALLGLAGLTARARQSAAPGTPCTDNGPLAPSRDLYCIELDPVAALPGARGSFELNRIPSPFGSNVTRDGAQRYAPILRIAGLPDPGGFAPGATVWVAWIATPQLHPTRRLGVVGNGSATLPAVDWPKFIVLVTAERAADAEEPAGRVALRGFSASNRKQPPDLLEFLYGTPPVRAGGAPNPVDSAGHAGHGAGAAPASGTAPWVHPPMPPGFAMMPAEMQLPPPAVTPFLPRDPGAEISDARPRELVRLRDGDTLVLTAGPVRRRLRGQSFVGYGYNGQIPGPLLSADEGATIHVRYQNRIPWGTTVHWHGVRLENRFDGAEGLTQPAVPPGGDFDYDVHLRDPGIYWYHPHRRDDLLRDLGLAGNLFARPAGQEGGPVHREEVLLLDDFELGDGSAGPVPFGAERTTHALMGRFGNVLLVNGRPDWTLDVDRSEVVRFHLTNGANARVFNLSFGGAWVKVVGSDVSGFEREEWVESVVIAPAERYSVDVRFDEPGQLALENRVLALDHTFGRFVSQVDTLGKLRVSSRAAPPGPATAFETLHPHPRVTEEITRYRSHFARAPDKTLAIRMEAEGLPFVVDRFLRFDSVYFHPVEWGGTMPMMNWNATSKEVRWILEEPATGRRNMDIRWDFARGQLLVVRIANPRESLHAMQHPIHFHGQRFLVLRQNGVANTNLAWKDTFLLPAGGTADLLLELANPGAWMAHCHISEHLESGMMFSFTVK